MEGAKRTESSRPPTRKRAVSEEEKNCAGLEIGGSSLAPLEKISGGPSTEGKKGKGVGRKRKNGEKNWLREWGPQLTQSDRRRG